MPICFYLIYQVFLAIRENQKGIFYAAELCEFVYFQVKKSLWFQSAIILFSTQDSKIIPGRLGTNGLKTEFNFKTID